MPNKKKSESQCKANQAMTKYRRLQTLINKTVEMSEKCGVSLNLLVLDKYNKITEYFTDEKVLLRRIKEEMD